MKKVFFLFAVYFLNSNSFYNDFKTELNEIICQKKCDQSHHEGYYSIYNKLFKIWFVLDVLGSLQQSIEKDDSTNYEILSDINQISILIKNIETNIFKEHLQDNINIINLLNYLLIHPIIEYSSNFTNAIELCMFILEIKQSY